MDMVVDIYTILNQWQTVGVFDIVLPFVLIFAIIFGILSATHIIGDNKGVHVVIAAAVALLSLRSGFVQGFFAEIFPRLGVGLAVVLAFMILVGLFISKDEARYWMWGLGTLGVLVGAIAMYNSFDTLGYFDSYAWQENMGWIILGVAVIGIIVAIVASSTESKDRKPIELGLLRK